tara:strand:+ start:206 stop:805 length:600 start_codon:yes stop_codon:yes gene_type:complete
MIVWFKEIVSISYFFISAISFFVDLNNYMSNVFGGDNMANKNQSKNLKHPAVSSIADLLSFKVARFSAINQRLGGYWFKKIFNLSLNDWRILGLTAAKQPIAFKIVQKTLDMDKGQLSRSVKVLVGRGYISTGPSALDGRAIDLRVTDVGKKLSIEMLNFSKSRNDIAVDCLTKSECEQFLQILKKLTDYSNHILDSYE